MDGLYVRQPVECGVKQKELCRLRHFCKHLQIPCQLLKIKEIWFKEMQIPQTVLGCTKWLQNNKAAPEQADPVTLSCKCDVLHHIYGIKYTSEGIKKCRNGGRNGIKMPQCGKKCSE